MRELWFDDAFENPQSHEVETRIASVERGGDVIVSCGVFKPGVK